MKIIGIVPARYQSSRLPGKPIVDICGKPMIWWVYQEALKVGAFAEVLVATDDERVRRVCDELGMKVLMTSRDGACLIDRLYEVSGLIEADYYVSINGDEPLIEGEIIPRVFPEETVKDRPVIRGLMRQFTDPVEVIDPGNMKLVCNEQGKLIYMSRSPIPYPHKTTDFFYKKYVGVECYNRKALEFYHDMAPGPIERIEDLGTLRFLENGADVFYTLVESSSLSVDTARDLESVRKKMQRKLETKYENLERRNDG